MTSTDPAGPATRVVDIVPHTHWDREWYAPYQRFRARLVELLDDLLPRLEDDPTFTHFLLDGQMAVVDDYLAIRPDERARLVRLAAAGRLGVGPWYTLPDEFLVSGETHIRNLQLGLATADGIGGAMRVGYLPDMFGHIAQMPQLFRLFGFDHAVVWRGVPAAIDRTGFWWEAPDGSTVRAEYLPTGYGNGAAMPTDPERFVGRIDAWIAENATVLAEAPVLWMNGSDHRTPQPGLPATVAAADTLAGDRLRLRITSLADHLAEAPTEGLPRWRGELRSGARANLLMGVTSNRVDVRIAAARAERVLERVAEPLAAALLTAEQYPHALLAEAWLAMCRNAAHDSVCACSDDEVVATVLHRYAQARQIGDAVEESVLRRLADELVHTGPVAVNSLARTRSGTLVVRFPGTDAWPGTQVVDRQPADRQLCDLPIAQALAVVPELTGWTDDLAGVTIAGPDLAGEVAVTLHGDGSRGPLAADRSTVAERLGELAAGGTARSVRAVLRRPPTFDALVAVADVPALGWRPATPAAVADLTPRHPVRAAGPHALTNGLVAVSVAADGTFAVDGFGGLGRLVDGGDCGDTYNYCAPAHDSVVDGPVSVHTVQQETGPVRGRLVVTARYDWPARVDADTGRRIGDATIEVTTTIELRADESVVRVELELDNQARDHRVRAWFPLPEPVDHSEAECAFTVVQRGLTAEGGPTEAALATFPSRRFVRGGRLTVFHEGLHEYELVDRRVDGAHALALTLLRATRWLSAGPMASRPLPAGPVVELRGSQCLGRHVLRYAVGVDVADPFATADDVGVPLAVTYAAGLGHRPARHDGIEVRGAAVSAVHRDAAGALEIRVFNPRPEASVVEIAGLEGEILGLDGTVHGAFTGAAAIGPHEILTIRSTS